MLDLIVLSPEASDGVFGFHCQQAAEKLLKAALASSGIRYRRTHDIAELMDLALDHGLRLVACAEDLRTLTPYAVDMRYESFGMDIEGTPPMDRLEMREHIRKLRAWAEEKIGR